MKRWLALICLLLAPTSGALAQAKEYTLNPGDTLQIMVWKEDQLDRETLIAPDGTISFPLAGRFSVKGMTVDQVRDQIASRIKPLIPDADVTVSVKQALGNRVFVTGQVNKPGEYAMNGRLSVMQALSLAGGLTPYAGEKSIRILRSADGQQKTFSFNYAAVESGESLDTNVILEAGDVIVVPSGGLF
ncbi:polysaccharide biosynthesis/export family protein [Lacibacterium aquatile]|uniref:Polysaccharide biosynthesis/export family protein n=1 Tax=Lacibacterium aquatile TaxID=1168082 RepID=A0ABW5DWS4_9PROT